MNKEFFDYVRSNPSLKTGKLSNAQVQSAEEIINAGLRLGLTLNQVAYILATAWHESKLTPKRESLYYTTAERLMTVWPSRFKTKAAATPYLRNEKKLANFVYGGRLGNRPGTDDGWLFRGGGLDMLTGRENYARVGIDHRPETILQPATAVSSLVHGMTTGRYRGVKLSDYVNANKTDYVNARAVVNADTNRIEVGNKTVGALVAEYARAFQAALSAGKYGEQNIPRPVAKPAPPKTGLTDQAGAVAGVIFFIIAIVIVIKVIFGV